MKRIALGLVAVLLAVGAAYAADPWKTMDTSLGKAWTDQNGMTLYTFDTDGKGATVSACTDKCITAWPPFLAAADAKPTGEWTLVDVKDKDGANQVWSLEGGAPSGLIRDGWTSKTLKPGDEINLKVDPLRSGAPGGAWNVNRVKFKNGDPIVATH